MLEDQITVLVVDDEPEVRNLLCDWLTGEQFKCVAVGDGKSALGSLSKQEVDIVLLDVRLPGMSGIDVLSKILETHPGTAVIMVSAIDEVDTAVKSMRLGAFDYIVKPFDARKLDNSILLAVAKTIEMSLAVKEFSELDAIAQGVDAKRELIDRHALYVACSTVEIARKLGISDKVINDWAESRINQKTEKERVIRVATDKLKRSPLAQNLLGTLAPYTALPGSGNTGDWRGIRN